MSTSGDLAAEAVTLLTFVLGRRPTPTLVDRYVQAIERISDGAPMQLPWVARRCPSALALFQPIGKARSARHAVLVERLDATLALCETTPEGASRFCNDGSAGRMRILAAFAAALCIEALLLPFRILMTRVIWP